MIKSQGAMGRNPFGKKQHEKKFREVKVENIESIPQLERLKPKIADFIWVDLPAESYVIGLKTVLITKDFIQNKLAK